MLIKYEEQNQTLIFWTNGINKITFVNIIIKFSLIFLLINFIFSLILVPSSQDKARSFIRKVKHRLFASSDKTKKIY